MSSDNSVPASYGDRTTTWSDNSVTTVYGDAKTTSLNNSVTAVYDDLRTVTETKTANPYVSQRLITGLIQNTTGTSTLQSFYPANQGMSSGSMAGVVASILAVVLVAALIVLCIWKRRSAEGPIRVWQVARNHTMPKERTTWHDDDERGADTTRSFNPNMELQPNNIFTSPDTFIDHDEDMSCGYKDPSPKTRSDKDRETVVYNNSNTSFKLRDDACINNDVKRNCESDLKLRHAVEQDRAISQGHLDVEGYSIEEKKSNKKWAVVETTGGDYDLAGHIDEEPHQSEDDYMDLDKETGQKNVNEFNENTEEQFSATGEEGDGDYLAMRLEDDWQYQHTDIRQIRPIHNEQVPDDIYVNVDTVRRVQSMYATLDDQSRTGPNEHLPRRIVSDMKRPPIPQPRLSKKNDFDPYDYLPVAVPVRIPLQYHSDENTDHVSGRLDDADNNSNGNSLKNASNEANNNLQSIGRYSDADGANDILRDVVMDGNADNPIEDNVYDYPRKRSQSIESETFNTA